MRKTTRLLLVFLAAFLFASLSHAQSTTQCLIQGVWTPCSMAPQPSFVQAPVSNKSSGSVASINAAYGSNVTKGNTLIVVFANGNNNNAAAPITDTLSLTWFKAIQVANGSAFETEIWYAPVTGNGGADTVTVTPGGSNASIAMTIYEVSGLVYPPITSAAPNGGQALEQTTSATGTGGTSPAVSLTPIVSNEYVFVGFGLGTAAQTITVASPYVNDSGQQNPTTPAGLFSFVSSSFYKSEMITTSPSATATSEPWAVAVASFKTLSVPIQGTVQGMGTSTSPSGGVASVQVMAGGDPCASSSAWVYYPINVSSNTQIVAGSSGKNVYVCKMFIQPVAAAANVELVESATSGNACATSPTGLMGGNTAATGGQVAINGGFVLPADQRAWAKTATTGDAMCIFVSAATTGVLAYVQQ